MSVLVKNMEMPKTCWGCQFGDDCGETVHCNITGESQIADKRHDCPLIEIPTPHGRLIDADKLHEATYHRAFETDGDTMWQSGCWVRYRAIEQVQDSQPTIIEAEEE